MTRTEQAAPAQFRHLGILGRRVTLEQANIDSRILRFLFRWGGQTENLLWHRLKVEPEAVRQSLARLTEWGMVELDAPRRGTASKVVPTGNGKFWGLELVSHRQLAGKDADGE